MQPTALWPGPRTNRPTTTARVVTLLATADTGYVFADWSGDLSGSDQPGDNRDGRQQDGHSQLRRLPVDLDDISGTPGARSLSPAKDLSSTTMARPLTIVAAPAANHHFVNWTGTAVDAGQSGESGFRDYDSHG